MNKINKIHVNGLEISILSQDQNDLISLTDMIKNLDNNHVIVGNWLRQKHTLEFLGFWERINNRDFKLIEFDELLNEAGSNKFTLSPKKWIETTNAKSITSKAGKNGGTFAHKDVAFHFGLWLSPEFNLLLITEFQRLKDNEAKGLNQVWDYRRFLTKANYRIQTDAVKEFIVPDRGLPKEKEGIIYAEEADLLYIAMFGYTSKEWKEKNPTLALKGGNLREYANSHQLIVLNNLEVLNAELIRNHIPKDQRVGILRNSAWYQLKSILNSPNFEDKLVVSPNLPTEASNIFNQNLGKLLNVPPPPKEEKKE